MNDPYSHENIYIDYTSRYPEYSDINTSDLQLMQNLPSYEHRFQSEQQGLPAKNTCNCGSCPECQHPRKFSMRRPDHLLEFRKEAPPVQCGRSPHPGYAPLFYKEGFGSLPSNDITLLVLVFILLVFVCYCLKTVLEVKQLLKSLKTQLETT